MSEGETTLAQKSNLLVRGALLVKSHCRENSWLSENAKLGHDESIAMFSNNLQRTDSPGETQFAIGGR